MYETYWQLKQKPFENDADPRFYYPASRIRRRCSSCATPSKTAAGRPAGRPLRLGQDAVAAMLPGAGRGLSPFVHLVFPQMSTAELLAYLADELTARLRRLARRADSVRRISGSWPPTPNKAGTP